MRGLGVAFAVIVLSGPALAQTSTNCRFIGNQMYCDTTAPPPVYSPPQFNTGLMSALIAKRQAEAEEQRQQEAADEAATKAQGEAILRRSLGIMIEQGRCDEARNIALDEGRLDMAALVNQACARPAPH